MNASPDSKPSPWRRRRKPASWDITMPVVGLLFLFLETSPRPIFGWNLESARILLQFPLLAFAFLAAWEKRFVPAIVLGCCLGVLQGWQGIQSLFQSGWSLEGVFPAFVWIVLMLSYLHPSRRGVYFGETNVKEPNP